jgi:hypothetical protein
MTTSQIEGLEPSNSVFDGVVVRYQEPENSSERSPPGPDIPLPAHQEHMSYWQRIKHKDRVLDGYLSTAASLGSALLSYLGGQLTFDVKVPTIISILLWIG